MKFNYLEIIKTKENEKRWNDFFESEYFKDVVAKSRKEIEADKPENMECD